MTDLAQKIETLSGLLPQLHGRDREFAESLIAWHGRRGLSVRQRPFVDTLIQRAQNPAPRETVEVGSLQRVIELLETAARHLRHPAVLLMANDMTLRLSIAGPRARVPGSVNVAGTGTYSERDWYGRVTRDGQFEPCRRYDRPTQQGVAAALQALAADPAAAAARYGHLTGVCCFCGRTLADERSTAVGYGSTCADHYGLPWGARAAAAARAEREEPVRRRRVGPRRNTAAFRAVEVARGTMLEARPGQTMRLSRGTAEVVGWPGGQDAGDGEVAEGWW